MRHRCIGYSMLATAAGLLVLIGLSCGGSSSPTQPQNKKPDITVFQANPLDIMPADSSLLTYTITNADSAVLQPGGKLATAASGSVYVKPARPTKYVLRAYNKNGMDSAVVTVTMNNAVPVLGTLVLSEDTVVAGDSVTLTWASQRADSVILVGVKKLTPASGGTLRLGPLVTTTYRAVAYNSIAQDTASDTLTVEVPTEIKAQNGLYYKAVMGTSTITPALKFQVVDFASHLLRKPWIEFTDLGGDGVLAQDSAQVDGSGWAAASYSFIGQKGHTVIQAAVKTFDTLRVFLRASMLEPGLTGQGQYILQNDLFSMVKNFNGEPASRDVNPYYYINYGNYETTLGIVAAIGDNNMDALIQDDEPVIGVIITPKYHGKTKDSIGIGSGYSQIVGAFGTPSDFYYDATAPAAWVIEYSSQGFRFFCDPSDTTAFEIHMWNQALGAAELMQTKGERSASKGSAVWLRREP